ncbi:F-box protein [Rhynchospora pubera]|uniref:F-box protein n=1 Tax=Rhynchospora pubera TaxID=906938 RepID=A0AAV8E644_9POAL|nr:F-box protein [Rhynchospora pubera]
MAPPTKDRDLPYHLIHTHLLPRLPYKTLNRFKCVSKSFNSLITADAQFAADQVCSAHASSGCFVYMSNCCLSFFPDPAFVGVPDPSLGFLNPSSTVKLVTSTNGLLLLCGKFNGEKAICVCNPATREAAFVSNNGREKSYRSEMGLVYDPQQSPHRFIIVELLLHNYGYGLQYRFDVFLSDTSEWNRSRQTVCIDGSIVAASKPVCANGVIYWSCSKCLMWYDTEADLAGSITLPVIEGKVVEGQTHTGIYDGDVVYCRTWDDGIEVWRLTGGSRWDRLHGASWDSMIGAFDFCHGMRLRGKSQSEMFFKRWSPQPVGFDGRFVYFKVVNLKCRDKRERVFGWDCDKGRVEDKGEVAGGWCPDNVFNYVNSMARVPPILSAIS